MACLGSVLLDPATAVTKATTALLAMTALDPAARIAFTVPANGRVLVRMQGTVHGSAAPPSILLGVLQGTAIVARMAPKTVWGGAGAATSFFDVEALFVVGGLTAGATLTWDAAYGVETIQTGSAIKYGGPNNATANDAFGGLTFEVWDA